MKTQTEARSGRSARRGAFAAWPGLFRAAVAGIVLAGLGACALPVRNDVTVFHDWPAGLSQRTFRLVPRPEMAQDLEYRTYERIVREQLLAAGFVETAVPVLDVGFSYATREKRTRVIERSPAFSSSLYFGRGFSGGAVSLGVPLVWGPYYDSHYDQYTYERELRLDIADRRMSPPVRIYQATASNRGSEPAAVQALPYLMQAVLRDFPGRSGIARMVELERFEPAPQADTGPPAQILPGGAGPTAK